jgi:hypothetical protein
MNPLDERMHPVGTEPAWSESYYFNFVDPDRKIGMFTRMGFRPGDGWADGLHAVYLGGDRVAFTYGRRDIEADLHRYDHDLSVGGLSLVCVVPFQNWEVRYQGPAQDIADAAILLERRKSRPYGWYRESTLDMSVDFNALSEPHYAANGARGHFEQTGSVRGNISLHRGSHRETFAVTGFGVRDKSWGPRDWGAGSGGAAVAGTARTAGPAPFVNWFSMNFGADVALGGAAVRQADGTMRGSGWFHAEGRNDELTDVVIESTYRTGSIWHTGVHLTGRTGSGRRLDIRGKVLTVCPTKIPMRGGATFVNEGLAEFTLDGRTGYGIAEHWHAVRGDE